MSETSYFKEEYGDRFNEVITNNSTKMAIHRHIRRYFDRNNDVLFESGLHKRLFFRENPDQFIVFKTLRLNPRTVENTIKRTGLIEKQWVILNNPFPWTMAMLIREHSILKNKKEMDESIMYLTLYFYASLHFRQFPHGTNSDIMDYTINELSNKFHIKKYGTMFKALYELALMCHKTYEDELKEGNDEDIKKYIMSLRDRLSSFVINIAERYYENYENKNYLRTEADSNEEDSFNRVDSLSFQIENNVNKVMDHIISSGVNDRAVNLSSRKNNVSRSAMKSAITQIVNADSNLIREFILKILQVYIVNDKNDPRTLMHSTFIDKAMRIYSKSNTTDQLVLDIKDQLDIWLVETSPNYVRTERAATKSSFRKALYMYFIIMIRISNSNM